MRLKDIADSHQRLLREVTRQISKRLLTEFTNLPGADGPNIGIHLSERGRKVVMELPGVLLLGADRDLTGREAIRVRIKTRRDRMLFRPEPISLPKSIGAGTHPLPSDFSFGGGQGRGRGRR